MPAHAGVGLARQVAEKQTHGDEADAADGLRSAEVGQGTLPLVDVAVSHLARLSELSMGFAEPGGALLYAPEVDRAGAGRDLAEGELPLLGEIRQRLHGGVSITPSTAVRSTRAREAACRDLYRRSSERWIAPDR